MKTKIIVLSFVTLLFVNTIHSQTKTTVNASNPEISDNLDFSSASGKLHFQILSAFAEFERELIRERTLEGLKHTKMQGTILGRPKGSKDSKPRPKSGYIIKEAEKRKKVDESKGIFNPLKNYISDNTNTRS